MGQLAMATTSPVAALPEPQPPSATGLHDSPPAPGFGASERALVKPRKFVVGVALSLLLPFTHERDGEFGVGYFVKQTTGGGPLF